jgi:PAS domain S-box-containing protein
LISFDCRDERDVQSVLPFLKIGFNQVFKETTNLTKCNNELLTLEYGLVAMQRRLQAAHVLFTALEFTSDAVEIMNEQFKLLYVNNAFEKLTGQKLNHLSGQEFHKVHRQTNQNEREEWLKSSVALQSGKACTTSELPFRKADGQLIGTYSSLTIPVIVQGKTK